MTGQKKRSLRDMTPAQRAGVGAAAVVQWGLAIAALRDIRRRPARKLRGDRRAWTAASFVSFVGPISYFVFGRRR